LSVCPSSHITATSSIDSLLHHPIENEAQQDLRVLHCKLYSFNTIALRTSRK